MPFGEMSEDQDFAELVFTAWVETTETSAPRRLPRLCPARGSQASTKPSKRWTRLCLVRSSWPSSPASASRYRDFAARLLEYDGALVETLDPEGLEAMLPALATHLACPGVCAPERRSFRQRPSVSV